MYFSFLDVSFYCFYIFQLFIHYIYVLNFEHIYNIYCSWFNSIISVIPWTVYIDQFFFQGKVYIFLLLGTFSNFFYCMVHIINFSLLNLDFVVLLLISSIFCSDRQKHYLNKHSLFKACFFFFSLRLAFKPFLDGYM